MKILFIEPPKEFWFVMGEYLPPPLGILELAAYIEENNKNIEIDILDCQAEGISWNKLASRLESSNPDIISPSALATCNTYTVLRCIEMAKKIKPHIKTVVGGQHFTALASESLQQYPEIDFIIRGEGEVTLSELIKALDNSGDISNVAGISFRHDQKIIHNPNRPLIANLDELPFPAYHLVKDHMGKYKFKMMAGSSGYALVEASRGCAHQCNFCTQWEHWGRKWRTKSPERIADEMEYLFREHGSTFLWLTDDNLGLGKRTNDLCDELIKRDLSDDLVWFVQARSDDIIKHQKILPKMLKAGNLWVMAGLERHEDTSLKGLNKTLRASDAQKSMNLLKENGIFAQATFITGDRVDSHESMEDMREFVNQVNPDLAIFMILTPFPGTELYETASQKGWIEDYNWNNYDMIHAVMPTEHLSRLEVQEELYKCYRSFYGSNKRRITGLFSQNKLKRKTFTYMASQGLLQSLRDLF
jgi:anaerobic magnesium-protoporphyrin IX monomethyl ester cyclase